MLELGAELCRRGSRERMEPRPPRWLVDLRERLDEWPLSTAVSLTDLARTVDRDPASLARIFRRHFHRSIGEYSRERRVMAAAEQLRNTRKSVARIAADLGFFDQSHLRRHFRRQFGMTPIQYRDAASP